MRIFADLCRYVQICRSFPEILQQQQHFIKTSTIPEGCHMSNDISQNEINMANEPLKGQQPLLEKSSEMDKLQSLFNQYGAFSSNQNYRDGAKFFLENFE